MRYSSITAHYRLTAIFLAVKFKFWIRFGFSWLPRAGGFHYLAKFIVVLIQWQRTIVASNRLVTRRSGLSLRGRQFTQWLLFTGLEDSFPHCPLASRLQSLGVMRLS